MTGKQFQPAIISSKLLALCLSVWFGAVAAQAQNGETPAAQQQRPRRVNDTVGGAGKAAPVTPATAQESGTLEVGDDELVRVNTQLVSVPAAVTDGEGRTLANLKAGQFVLYEDGKPQQIANFATTDAPFEVALLLDTSGSTRDDVSLIRNAAKAFIHSLRDGDRVALLAFKADQNDKSAATTIEVLQPLTSDRALLGKKLNDLTSGYGTPLYDALRRAVKEVFREPPAQDSVGRRAFVALTDGVDSTSRHDFKTARADLVTAGVACYFVQIDTEDFVEDRLVRDCQDSASLHLSVTQMQRFRKLLGSRADSADYRDFCKMGPFERMEISRSLYKTARSEMTELARISGGRVFPVQGLDEAQAAFAQVAAEIGTQYSLGYYSSNKARDGKFRQIRVEVKVKGAQVRAREGYLAPAN